MAEIRVEPRQKSRGWLWIVLLLIVIVAVLYWLYASGMLGGGASTTPAASPPVTPTSMMDGAPTWIATASAILTSSLIGGTHGTPA